MQFLQMQTLVVILCSGQILACASHPYSAPINPYTQGDVILAASQQQVAHVKTLAVLSRIDYQGKQGRFRTQQNIAIKRPQQLYIHTQGAVGELVSTFTVNKDSFQLLDARQNKFLTGPSTPENLQRFLPIPLAPDQLIQIFMGRLPKVVDANYEVEFNPTDGLYHVEAKSDSMRQWATLDPTHLTLKSFKLWSGQKRIVKIVLDHYKHDPILRYPQSIKVESKQEVIEIKINDAIINGELADSLFQITPPDGVEINALP
jgi:outer membrane lipoprotein-sorting protein